MTALDPAAAAPDREPPTGDPELAALVGTGVTSGVIAAPARRRSPLARRFGISFALGVLLALGVGVGVLYAWGQQYDGRVLPGVHVGGTQLGGLTRAEAETKIANAFAWVGTGQIALTGPDGHVTTITYADLHRRLDTSVLLDTAL